MEGDIGGATATPPRVPMGPNTRGDAPPQKRTVHRWQKTVRKHGARGVTMRRELTRRLTQINGAGHARDIARERQQSPPQKRTRLSPRRSEGRNEWATPTGPPTEEQTGEKATDPGRGRTKQRGKNSRWLAASGREQQALSNRPRHQPQPAEKRVGYERPPQASSKGRGGNT